MHVGGIEEVFEGFLSLLHNILDQGQQRTIPTVHSLDSAPFPLP